MISNELLDSRNDLFFELGWTQCYPNCEIVQFLGVSRELFSVTKQECEQGGYSDSLVAILKGMVLDHKVKENAALGDKRGVQGLAGEPLKRRHHTAFKHIWKPGMLKDFAGDCISALPLSARLPIEVAKVAIKDSLRNWTSAVYLVKGKITGEFRQGSMIYFGEQHRYYRSWISKFFADNQPVSSLGRMRIPDILRIKGLLAEHDLVLCPVNWLTAKIFSRGKWLIIPRHVNCVIDLRRPIKEIFYGRKIKKRINAIRQFEYSLKVLRTESALTAFFYEMLLPTVRKRHQDRAFISDFQHLKSVFANGFLLAVYRGSEWVGAKLVHCQSNNTLRSANVAWRNGDEGLMKDRVGEALMFELINRGKAEGFEFLDLGNSLPFVDDGALSFKIRWGTDLVFPYIRFEGGKLQGATGFLAAAFNLTSQSAQAMLHHNPVLVCHKGAVKAVG